MIETRNTKYTYIQSADEQPRRMQIHINTIIFMMHANARNQRRELDSFFVFFIGCRFCAVSILFMIVIFVLCIFSVEAITNTHVKIDEETIGAAKTEEC